MRKVVLLILMAILSHSFVFCNLGIKIGSTISNQNWEYQKSDFNRNFDDWRGAYIGICYQAFEIKHAAIITEFSYSQMGTKEEVQGTMVWPDSQGYIDTGPISLENKFSFCSVTIQGRLKPDFNRINPYICLGPRVDYLIDKKSNYDSRVVEKFENISYGFVYGIGLEIKLFHSNAILLESTMNTDLSYLYKTDLLSVKKYSYDFKLGYSF